MNEVALRAPDAVARTLPPLSAGLLQAVYLAERQIDPGLLAVHVAGVRAEAETQLAALSRCLQPAPSAWIAAWFGRVNLAMPFVLTPDDLDLRTPSLVEALSDVPRAAISGATARVAAQTFDRFPGAKEARDFLLGQVAPLMRRARELRRVLDAEVPAERKPLSEAERTSVLGTFSSLLRPAAPPRRSVDDQLAALGVSPGRSVKPLTPDQLRAARSGARPGSIIPATEG